jgi:hypothetical protein
VKFQAQARPESVGNGTLTPQMHPQHVMLLYLASQASDCASSYLARRVSIYHAVWCVLGAKQARQAAQGGREACALLTAKNTKTGFSAVSDPRAANQALPPCVRVTHITAHTRHKKP